MGLLWVNLGKPKWETNVNAHLGILSVKPGQTKIGNKCEYQYGSHMGQTWGNPNGKFNSIQFNSIHLFPQNDKNANNITKDATYNV